MPGATALPVRLEVGMVRNVLKVLIPCLIFFIVASDSAAMEGRGKIRVFVSIPPQKYFLEKIGAPHVEVSVMVPPGASPAVYEPRPRQMAALTKAKAYFSIGVPFERAWIHKITAANPSMRLVRTDRGIEKTAMKAHDHGAGGHSHGAGTKGRTRESGIPDPHIWTSPPLVKIQAGNILQGLTLIDPGNGPSYEQGFQRFTKEIDTLDRELRALFADKKGEAFMTFHPSWGYFSRTYGLRQIPIEVEGKEPKPAQLKRIIQEAGEMGIKVIFAQPEFSAKSARMIAGAIGGKVVFASPLSPDWQQNLKSVAAELKAALR